MEWLVKHIIMTSGKAGVTVLIIVEFPCSGNQSHRVSNCKWCFFFLSCDRFRKIPQALTTSCPVWFKPGGFSCLKHKNECKATQCMQKSHRFIKTLRLHPWYRTCPLVTQKVQVIAVIAQALLQAKQLNFVEKRKRAKFMKILIEKSSLDSSGIWQQSVPFEEKQPLRQNKELKLRGILEIAMKIFRLRDTNQGTWNLIYVTIWASSSSYWLFYIHVKSKYNKARKYNLEIQKSWSMHHGSGG